MRVSSALVLAGLVAAAAFAGDSKSRYLVIAPHTAEQCLSVLDDIKDHDAALLKKIDWGCAAGDHTGYLAVDADSEEGALKALPEKSRAGARAVKLVKFTPAQIKQFHQGK
ncbi:MAG TPA: hypothetical protein VLW85_10115 [Myxococcales bacterium]|nr:hypothetical protein [Myxococcales bacterium]